MQVGIMSGTFARPSLEESLDTILEHDIRHLQFNLGTPVSYTHLTLPTSDLV